MSDFSYTGLTPVPFYTRQTTKKRQPSNPPTSASASVPDSSSNDSPGGAGGGPVPPSSSSAASTAAASGSTSQPSSQRPASRSTAATTATEASLTRPPSVNSRAAAAGSGVPSSQTPSTKAPSSRATDADTTDTRSIARSERSDTRSSKSGGSSNRKRSTASSNSPAVPEGLIPVDAFGFGPPKQKPRPPPPSAKSSNKSPPSTGNSKNAGMYPDTDSHKQSGSSRHMTPGSASFSRTESVSSTSVTTAPSTRTATSTDPSYAGDTGSVASRKPFVQRNGRTYLSDPSLSYPLPVDLTELHRQSLRTLLLIQVHGAPVACPALTAKPPLRVLEVGCGPGFWSMMCHRYFKGRGHSGVSFTGMDVAPGSSGAPDTSKPDRDMKWTFVQHDLRTTPWPFADDEFDMVFSKDMSLAISPTNQVTFIEESVRVLKSGGILEIWETDHAIRMLRPHVPNASAMGNQAGEQEAASSLGSYMININTPLSAPLNTFLVEYNSWLTRALEARDLIANPCTMMNHHLLQESEVLSNVGSHRVAIPLSEVRWEREGVGGVVTKDGKSYVEMKGDKLRPPHQMVEKKNLTAGQAALRRTALLTLVEEIQALEPILRDVSGKSQDEMDVWMGKMMMDLMMEGGTSWGECLESGAWWAKKK